MKTYSAYAFWWWFATFGIWTTINGYFYTWTEAQAESWAIVFAIGLMILILAQHQRWLK